LFFAQSTNARLLVSWHGFLHSAIATRFPADTLRPENPFFAGEPLPYYWFYQWLAAGIGSLLRLDPIRAFQCLILASLASLMVAGAALGRSLLGSSGVGLLAAYLAVAGANPLGPAVAASKLVLKGESMVNPAAPPVVRDGVFVTNALADQYLVHPVLPALYYGDDWRRGQNVVWFFDISSRAPAIALTVAALFWFLRTGSRAHVPVLVALGAALASINPVMGLPTAGALLGAAGVAALSHRLRAGVWSPTGHALVWRGVALLSGALLAAPTYSHLFVGGQGGSTLSTPDTSLVKWIALALIFTPIAALAIWGALRALERIRHGMVVTALAGLSLLGGAFLVDLDTLRGLERGNEHNLTNAALCLLAIPAVAWIRPPRRALLNPAMAVFLFFLPTTLLTVGAYLGSPPLPLEFHGRILVRVPSGGPLDGLYRWIRATTPSSSVFVVDPSEPVKMSGNVSELPAFTGRTLFVDLPGYMTDAHPEAQYRRDLATALVSGIRLTEEGTAYLRRLNRPLYVVTYHAENSTLLDALQRRYGPPAYRQGFVAAFPIDPDVDWQAGREH
jgi:hypothetical protein